MRSRILRSSVLFAWAVVLTALTFFVGGTPLKALRRGLGRTPFWAAGMAVATLLIAVHWVLMGVAFLSLVILIGLFGEWEEMGLSFLASSFFSLLVTGLIGAGGFALWVYSFGAEWKSFLLSRIDLWLKPALQMSPNIKVNPYDIMMQLPSIVVIGWMVALYLAVLLERRVRPPYGESVPHPQHFLRRELFRIHVPTAVIWVFILALLGAFSDYNVKWLEMLSVNFLNVCLMLFFFQGLAVVLRLFEMLKVGVLWQILLMVLFIVQLFLVVSLVGLIDHWIDFRGRMSKRMEMNKELQ